MAYFDNAATTYPKPECVYSMMDGFYRHHGGSYGRGNYDDVLSAGNLVTETRHGIKELLHCPAKNVIFTPSATISLNMILQGLINSGKIRNVYITPFEHNSVTRTLHYYEKRKQIRVGFVSVSHDFHYQLDKIRQQFAEVNPDLVVLSHASNVTGMICPAQEIFSLSKTTGSINVIDMAQTAGLVDLDVGSQLIDFAVFAGHKTMYGPTGLSGFVMNPEIDLDSILFGGTGFDSANQDMPNQIPERYEMGTLNILGIAGLHAALEWIKEVGISSLLKKELEHRQRLIELLGKYDFMKIIGGTDGDYVGIISAIMPGFSSDSAGLIFNERNIEIRSGLQCAPIAHKFIGTYPAGTLRFSTSFFTSDSDFEELEIALNDIQGNL